MSIQTHRWVGVIKAENHDWEQAVRQQIDEGANFLLVLPNERDEVEKFCRLFGLPANCTPRTLSHSGFFRLGQFIDPEIFDELLANWNRDKQVVYVEQLDFPINRPPRRQPFLVYSPVLGVIAEATTMAGAKEALADYEQHWGQPQPEASIYIWQKGRWNLYEGR